MISIKTLSLLAYFTYIFIDIIFYALVSTSWSSGIFWMVGRVIAGPYLGLLSSCEVVPLVLILVNRFTQWLSMLNGTTNISLFLWCLIALTKY
jgi:hypothetical protein